MWGQDLYFFLTIKGGALAFWPDFHTAPEALLPLLVIPQGWTLGLELSFYLTAPFLVRRSLAVIFALLAASLLLRLLLQLGLGYSGDPWSYRFFPFELAIFLVGAIGYRVYRSADPGRDPRLLHVFILSITCIGTALLINRWHGVGRLVSVAFLMAAVFSIPFLFEATKKRVLDRHLGELSYPVYISHFLVIWFLDAVATLAVGMLRGLLIIIMTLTVSLALYWWIDRPNDVWRQRRLDAARKGRALSRTADQPGLAMLPKGIE
jgi:peptidoglycan/LPS O-acetylase OafA/YrhL